MQALVPKDILRKRYTSLLQLVNQIINCHQVHWINKCTQSQFFFTSILTKISELKHFLSITVRLVYILATNEYSVRIQLVCTRLADNYSI